LKAGGWQMRASGAVSAEDLMAQVRRIAERRNSGRPARLRVKLGNVVFVLIRALADLVNGG
jgi:hypothetical protein